MVTFKEYWTPRMSAPCQLVFRNGKQVGALMQERIGWNLIDNKGVYAWRYIPEKGPIKKTTWRTLAEAKAALV